MKIALAQIDTLVGDIDGNSAKIREATIEARSRGANLIAFPELTVSGYDPRDLLRMPSFLDRCERAVEELARPAEWNREVAIIIGFPMPNRDKDGAPASNACALIHEGRISAVARKSLLPSYDVLEEPRYFEPADQVTVVSHCGVNIGLTICEDVWSSPRFHTKRPHKRDPVSELTLAGADVIINLAASPFHAGKPAFRERMLSALASEQGVQVVMTNSVGGNDGTVFDGTSLAVAADGQTVVRCRSFEEDLRIFDTTRAGTSVSSEVEGPREDLDEIHEALLVGIRDYCRKTGFSSVTLGLSGGVDSALVAALAAEALGPENVVAVTMPSRYSSEGSFGDARVQAKTLGIDLREVSIERPFSAFQEDLAPLLRPSGGSCGERALGLMHENIQPRVRATYLMALSNAEGHLLLACGNKSEIAVGYCTIYGDMAGGLSPIGDLLKTRVYALAKRINEKSGAERIPKSVLEKAPSAELAPGQRDQDSLPPYEVLDPMVAAFVEEGAGSEEIAARGFEPELVDRVIGLILRSEHKRRQAAPVIKVSPCPFTSGYRLPIAARPKL